MEQLENVARAQLHNSEPEAEKRGTLKSSVSLQEGNLMTPCIRPRDCCKGLAPLCSEPGQHSRAQRVFFTHPGCREPGLFPACTGGREGSSVRPRFSLWNRQPCSNLPLPGHKAPLLQPPPAQVGAAPARWDTRGASGSDFGFFFGFWGFWRTHAPAEKD